MVAIRSLAQVADEFVASRESTGVSDAYIGPMTVVSLNAWESDYFGDPLFSIVSALVGRIQESSQEVIPKSFVF